MYQNVTVGISALGALGQNIEDMVTEMGGVREEYLETMDQYLVPLPESTFFTILPGAIRMWRKQRAGLKNPESFLDGNPGWCRATCRRIEAMHSKDELATLAVEELKPRSLESFWQNYATALRYGGWVGKLRRSPRRQRRRWWSRIPSAFISALCPTTEGTDLPAAAPTPQRWLALMQRYRSPRRMMPGFAWSALTLRPRSLCRDAQAAVASLRPPMEVVGGEHVPAEGPCLVACNHYSPLWFSLPGCAPVGATGGCG